MWKWEWCDGRTLMDELIFARLKYDNSQKRMPVVLRGQLCECGSKCMRDISQKYWSGKIKWGPSFEFRKALKMSTFNWIFLHEIQIQQNFMDGCIYRSLCEHKNSIYISRMYLRGPHWKRLFRSLFKTISIKLFFFSLLIDL